MGTLPGRTYNPWSVSPWSTWPGTSPGSFSPYPYAPLPYGQSSLPATPNIAAAMRGSKMLQRGPGGGWSKVNLTREANTAFQQSLALTLSQEAASKTAEGSIFSSSGRSPLFWQNYLSRPAGGRPTRDVRSPFKALFPEGRPAEGFRYTDLAVNRPVNLPGSKLQKILHESEDFWTGEAFDEVSDAFGIKPDAPAGFSPLRGTGRRVPYQPHMFSTKGRMGAIPIQWGAQSEDLLAFSQLAPVGPKDATLKKWTQGFTAFQDLGLENIEVPGLGSTAAEMGFQRQSAAGPSAAAGQQLKLLRAQTKESFWKGGGRSWADRKALATEARINFWTTQTWAVAPYGPTSDREPVPAGVSREGGWRLQSAQARQMAETNIANIALKYQLEKAEYRTEDFLKREMNRVIRSGQRINSYDKDVVGGPTAQFRLRSANVGYLDYLEKRTTLPPWEARELYKKERYRLNAPNIVTEMTISASELQRRKELGSVPASNLLVRTGPVMPNNPIVRAVSRANEFLGDKVFGISPTLEMLQVERHESANWKPYTRRAAYNNRDRIMSTVVDAPIGKLLQRSGTTGKFIRGTGSGSIGSLILGTHLTLDDSFLSLVDKLGVKGFHKATVRLGNEGQYIAEFAGQTGEVGRTALTRYIRNREGKITGRYSRIPDLTTRKVSQMSGFAWSGVGMSKAEIEASSRNAIERLMTIEEISATRGSTLGGPALHSLGTTKGRAGLQTHLARYREELTRLSVTDPAQLHTRMFRRSAQHVMQRGAAPIYEAGLTLERAAGAPPIPLAIMDEDWAKQHGIKVWTKAGSNGSYSYQHAGVPVRIGQHVNIIGDFASDINAIHGQLTPEVQGMLKAGQLIATPASFAKTSYKRTASGDLMPDIGIRDPLAMKRAYAEMSGMGLQTTIRRGLDKPTRSHAEYSRTGKIQRRHKIRGHRSGPMGMFPKDIEAALMNLDVAGTEKFQVLSGGQIVRPGLAKHEAFMKGFRESGELYLNFENRGQFVSFVSGLNVQAHEKSLAFQNSRIQRLGRSRKVKSAAKAVMNLDLSNAAQYKFAIDTIQRIVQSDVDLTRDFRARKELSSALSIAGGYADLGIEPDEMARTSKKRKLRVADMTERERKEAFLAKRASATKRLDAERAIQNAVEELANIHTPLVDETHALLEARRLASGETSTQLLSEDLSKKFIASRRAELQAEISREQLHERADLLARKAKKTLARGKPRSFRKLQRRATKVRRTMAHHHRLKKDPRILEERMLAEVADDLSVVPKLPLSHISKKWRGGEQALVQWLTTAAGGQGVSLSTSRTGLPTVLRNLSAVEGVPVTDLAAKTQSKGLALRPIQAANPRVLPPSPQVTGYHGDTKAGPKRFFGRARESAINRAAKAKAAAQPTSIWAGASKMFSSLGEAAADYDFSRMMKIIWGEGQELTWRRIGIGGVGAITAAALVGSVAESITDRSEPMMPMPSPGSPLPPRINIEPSVPRAPMFSPRPVLEMPMSRTTNERVVMTQQGRDINPMSFLQAPAMGNIRVTQMNHRPGLYNHMMAQEVQDNVDNNIWNPIG